MHLVKNPHIRYKVKSQHKKDKIDILVSLKLYWKLWKEAKTIQSKTEYMRTINFYKSELNKLNNKFKQKHRK